MKKFQLLFKGKKEELHTQLKTWCKEADRTMNGTVLELIQKHLQKYEKKQKDNNQNQMAENEGR